MFTSIDDVTQQLASQRYVTDRQLATVVFLATRLDKPVLVEGPAGVGKTELAKALAGTLDRRLIRLQCYEGLDEAKALYEWEYGKQLLYTQMLRGQIDQVLSPASDLREAAASLRLHDDVFFNEEFLVERPVLAAIRSEQPVVLLVDEIDRSDEEFEAFLLEVLSDYQVSIPEIGTLTARNVPLVVLTSNATRELSEALKRRCLHLHLGYPGTERELEIVRLRAPEVSEQLAKQLVSFVQSLRELELRKAPSVGETLDWAQALVALQAQDLSKELITETLGVLVKHERDAQKVLAHLGANGEGAKAAFGDHAAGENARAFYESKRNPGLRPGERG